MKNIFSIKLYINCLKRLLFPSTLTTAVILGINFYSLPSAENGGRLVREVCGADAFLGCIAIFPFILFAVNLIFDYLGKKEGIDRILSLPQKNSCIFLSFSASIYTAVALCIIVANTVCAVIYPFINVSLDLYGFIIAIINQLVCSFSFTSLILLCRVLAQNVFACLMYSGILCFFTRITTYVMTYAAELTTKSINTFYSWTRYFIFGCSPFYIAFKHDIEAYEDMFLIFALFLEFLVLFLASTLLYCKKIKSKDSKRFETIAHRIFMVLFSVPLTFSALVIAFISQNVNKSYAIILLCGCILVYFISEIIKTKKLKKAFLCLGTLAVSISISGILCGMIYLSKAIIDRPIEKSEIESVALLSEYDIWDYKNLSFKDRNQKSVSGYNVYDSEAIKLVSDSLKNTLESGQKGETPFKITLNNGKVVYRNVVFRDKRNEYMEISNKQYNEHQENQEQQIYDKFPKIRSLSITYKFYDEYYKTKIYELTVFKQWKLRRTLKNEYNGLSHEEKKSVLTNSVSEGENYYIINNTFFVTEKHTPKTFALLEQHRKNNGVFEYTDPSNHSNAPEVE